MREVTVVFVPTFDRTDEEWAQILERELHQEVTVIEVTQEET